MVEVMKPFATTLSFAERMITPCGQKIERRLSHMRGMYQDIAETEAILERDDPLIYAVYTSDVPEEEGQLPHCLTVLYPGRVGDEYYMTKGHFHVAMDTAEIYLGLEGEGYLLMQTKEGDSQALEMGRGTIAYISPCWAHRTVNTGKGPFVFFAVWPGHAGHDYGTIEESGFLKLVVERENQPVLIPNPRYR
ncbi:MAG: glucose-6-phosphate isomerase [Anaerolineae bacterium]|nr:glucose-6-phosphate isomerase [Anaerolineae bacterium]